jgi:hypothetical protein
MYNTEFTPTYMDIQDEDLSNEKYQSDLLTVFNVTEYTDGLHEHMSILFKELNYPMDDILKHVFAFSSDPEMLFMLLFSYQHFKYTHVFVVDVLTKKDPTKSKEELISILIK